MERGPKFIGRKYSEDEKQEITKELRQWSEESKAPLEDEIEKTSEQLRMISVANQLIADEIAQLGISGYESIDPDRIHILREETGSKTLEGGSYTSANNSIRIEISESSTSISFFSTLVHEMIHYASMQRFYSDHEDNVMEARVGYKIRSEWKDPIRRNMLRGFNEIVVEMTIIKILHNASDILKTEFGITEDDLAGPVYSYTEYAPLMYKILEELAVYKKIPIDDVFSELERGQFDSNLFVLKDIERLFGKGSLKILAYLGQLNDPALQSQMDQMVFEYFNTTNQDKRAALQQQIEVFFTKNRLQEEPES